MKGSCNLHAFLMLSSNIGMVKISENNENMVEIGRKPKEIRIELPKPGEIYPKLILGLPISVRKNLTILRCERAKIILQRKRNGEIFEISASPYEKRLYPGVRQHIHFYTFLTPELCKDIES